MWGCATSPSNEACFRLLKTNYESRYWKKLADLNNVQFARSVVEQSRLVLL
jgi:hypothetical protein